MWPNGIPPTIPDAFRIFLWGATQSHLPFNLSCNQSGSFNDSTTSWNCMNSIADSADHKSDVDDIEERAMNVINVLHEMDPYYKNLAPPRLIHIIVELTKKILTATERDLEIARQNNNFSIGRNISVLRFMVTYGNIPLMSMAGGVACMALSTILFAASSQFLKPEVWIASLVALVGVMALSFLPICSFMLELFAVRFRKPLPFRSHLPEPVTSKN